MNLHPRLISDLPIIIASLFLSIMLWLMAVEGDTELENIDIPLTIVNKPLNMKIELQNAIEGKKVRLKIRYPKSMKGSIRPSNFAVKVDLNNIKGGIDKFETTQFNLNLWDIDIMDLGDEVQPVAILEPRPLYIKAKLFAKLIDIHIDVRGNPLKGYKFQRATAVPNQVYLTAPENVIAHINSVNTAPIELVGKKESFNVFTTLMLPDQVQIVEEDLTKFDVNVVIEEEETQITLKNVEIVLNLLRRDIQMIIDPPIANITVKGPTSIVKKITNESFMFICDITEEEGGTVQYTLNVRFADTVSKEIKEKVTIVNLSPKVINITLTNPAAAVPTPTLAPKPTPTSTAPASASATPLQQQ